MKLNEINDPKDPVEIYLNSYMKWGGHGVTAPNKENAVSWVRRVYSDMGQAVTFNKPSDLLIKVYQYLRQFLDTDDLKNYDAMVDELYKKSDLKSE